MLQQVEREPLESRLLSLSEQLTEEVYSSHACGQITLPQLQEIYAEMNLWAKHTEQLLTLLCRDGVRINE